MIKIKYRFHRVDNVIHKSCTRQLDADVQPGDIADALRQLKFDRNEFSAIKIDEQVWDYLVTSLSARDVSRRG